MAILDIFPASGVVTDLLAVDINTFPFEGLAKLEEPSGSLPFFILLSCLISSFYTSSELASATEISGMVQLVNMAF